MREVAADVAKLLSRKTKARRRFLAPHLPVDDPVVLEVGALDDPMFAPSEGRVLFADFFTAEELRARHAGDARRAERIVPVDYVLRDRTLSEVVDRPVDVTVANHVIEHLPDPIGWLREVRGLAAPGGLVFLAVPDRGYTFDHFKPRSDAVDWLRAHETGATRPDRWQILRHLYYHARVDPRAAWEGELPADHLHRIAMPDAIERAGALAERHTDVHCWVFTRASFETILADLSATGLIPWSVVAMSDVAPGSNEFLVVLRAA